MLSSFNNWHCHGLGVIRALIGCGMSVEDGYLEMVEGVDACVQIDGTQISGCYSGSGLNSHSKRYPRRNMFDAQQLSRCHERDKNACINLSV